MSERPDITIPEEAREAVTETLRGWTKDYSAESLAPVVLAVAAPSIVAEAMEDLAREYWSGSPVAKALRRRAAELRGVGSAVPNLRGGLT